MPVKSRDWLNPVKYLNDLVSEMLPLPQDIMPPRPAVDQVVSLDVWTKFGSQLELSDANNSQDDIYDILNDDIYEIINDDTFKPRPICPIRNHDCMWGGQCSICYNRKRLADEQRRIIMNINAAAPDFNNAPVPTMKQENKLPAPCQQSLLKPAVRAAASVAPTMTHTPQTPPMSDDEETKGNKPTQVLQILNQAISECDLEEDSDLCDYRDDYFDDDEDLDVDVTDSSPTPKETAAPNIRTCQFAAENDHSYHKDKNASMHMPNLGIDTPSDSEEEIDVVSVTGEKNRISLPTNPSTRDRQQIQRRMATAISKNTVNGIKTILPIRKASTETSPLKKKHAESRVVKRTRQYRTSPYKRRSTLGNSSDSEAEPSEKRSLHNNMERQRRIDLRNAFEELRLLVPEVNKKEKAAKVVILREASKYCYHLGNVSIEHNNHLNELKWEQERLRRKVSQLRRSLAATR